MTFSGKDNNGTVFKWILDRYEDEIVTDEQAERVLGPVLDMIEAGKFDRKKERFPRSKKSFIVVLAVAAIVGIMAAVAAWKQPGGQMTIEDTAIPLAAQEEPDHRETGAWEND
ncbi:MAG TPA: hypothetical protein DEB31_11975 [Clostridiales bacterium]|nr:hypothetical protein [Clostridiales bacterium]